MKRPRKLIVGSPYLFEWNDTYGKHGWFDDEDVRKNTLAASQQSSVGFFVQEVGQWYVIAKHKNEHMDFPPWGDLCWIPKHAVRTINDLD